VIGLQSFIRRFEIAALGDGGLAGIPDVSLGSDEALRDNLPS
jgi:hypothetical protein